MIALQDNNLESILKKAKELEKKYEWLQAAEKYGIANDFVKDEDPIKATEFLEKMGFSYYKAGMKAPNNAEFKCRMELAINTYKKEIELLTEKRDKCNQTTISHVLALIAYTSSCLESDPSKKKKFLKDWWNLENQVKEEYEEINDPLSIAKICTNVVEYSTYDWVWSSSTFSEAKNIHEKSINLAERAIQILTKSQDKYELARAYCFASWHYGFSHWYWESEEKVINFHRKAQEYSNRALKLAHELGDAWLISQSYITVWQINHMVTGNPGLAIESGKKVLKYGNLSKDNWCMGWGYLLTAFSIQFQAMQLEDPDKQKHSFEKSRNMVKQSNKLFKRMHCVHELHLSFISYASTLQSLIEIEANQKIKKSLLEKLNKLIKEKKEFFKNRQVIVDVFSSQLSLNFLQQAITQTEIEKKRHLLLQAKTYSEQQIDFSMGMQPFKFEHQSTYFFQLARVLRELSIIELNKPKKIDLLAQATDSIRKSLELLQKRKKFCESAYRSGYYFGKFYEYLGEILQQISFLTKDKKHIDEAIHAYKETIFYMKKAKLPTHIAEAYWHVAQLHDQTSQVQESSKNYELAAKTYKIASKKIPQLAEFYLNHSLYMQAWSQIEQARYSHSLEDYENARQHYEKASELHKSTSIWNYLASNYYAWAYIEEAEGLSRKENAQLSKQTFQKAIEQFRNAEESCKQQLETITSADEREMAQKLFDASILRRNYCQSRILLEEAKLLDREGKYLQSSRKYGEAAKTISFIVNEIDVEAERNELKYLEILCQAWQKMAIAEETTSSESYLEAAELFQKAKEYCYTKKASLWAMGNSSFCKGLAAGTRYQDSMDLMENALAKRHMKRAATSYHQAGFKNASEYAKATQRLFDAYVFMNQAESEVDPENKAKQYQMAENLLQLAAGSFMKSKQPEKTVQVQEILANVREERTLAVSLSQVMKAPAIASTTQSFAVPTQTNEVSVGLEQFEHANIQANLVAQVKEVKVGESFCLSVEFVNAGREPALLMRVDDFVPADFVVVKKPEFYRIEETTLNMKGKQLAPLKLVEVKLTLQPSKKGYYRLNPRVQYLDELGKNKSLQLKALEIKVEEVLLENRVTTGTEELDSLLFGGIPAEYAVVLSGPPCDERELIVKNFLEVGAKRKEAIFYIATEAIGLESLLENPNFFLFLCNPKPKIEVSDLPNVYRLQSKADITNLGIALTKAIRKIDQQVSRKRICVEILSNVLVKNGVNITMEWISGLITDLEAKGFTILGLLDPRMHDSKDSFAIINLFDGEISILQSDDPLDCKKSILIKKLRNQDYIKNPICLMNK